MLMLPRKCIKLTNSFGVAMRLIKMPLNFFLLLTHLWDLLIVVARYPEAYEQRLCLFLTLYIERHPGFIFSGKRIITQDERVR